MTTTPNARDVAAAQTTRDAVSDIVIFARDNLVSVDSEMMLADMVNRLLATTRAEAEQRVREAAEQDAHDRYNELIFNMLNRLNGEELNAVLRALGFDPEELLQSANESIEQAINGTRRIVLAIRALDGTGTAQGDGWRPIETAPKNTIVLLWSASDVAPDGTVQNWKMATGHFSSGYLHKNETGWTWGGTRLMTYDLQPTHWQPLPPPPGKEDEK